ncbi:hypothetical protein B0H21DRAFT_697910 [Amylocystis lapponica]|nr:hypothetical protein B0H21DRAFT_697910 [Amylocystis lapponica]
MSLAVRCSCRLHTGRRALSTSSRVSLSPKHAIYVSKSTNPYFNLSLEDWLFRHKSPKDPLLLLYRDTPCVVIGRNQNPWKEVNLRVSHDTGVPFIRRRSGGGAVYHASDLGNTNFSIHLPRVSFDRHATAQVVLAAVRSLGIDANVNDRNDICVGEDKISRVPCLPCSAYKIVNNRAYHHGTMLISSRLDMLGDLLHSNSKDTIDTKGVASVRSPVRNLQQSAPSVDHAAFVDAVVAAFRREYSVDEEICAVEHDEDMDGIEYVRHGIAELPSWQWAYGQTPEFTQTIKRSFAWGDITAQIHSKHGMILSCTLATSDTVNSALKQGLGEFADGLTGQKYGFVEEDTLLAKVGYQTAITDLWQWLRTEMRS